MPGLDHLPVSDPEDVDIGEAGLFAGPRNVQCITAVDATDPAVARSALDLAEQRASLRVA
jgi:hypothetical protein